MTIPALDRRPAPAPETRDPGVLVDVVVLSADTLLFDAIRAAIGERNPVWRARSAEESVDLLLTGRCGVLLLDMAVVTTRPATLVQQIAEQFPDVVVVVAGRRDDESLLAQMISDGLVYRFMHKPLTAKRAGMFLHAAIRCHVERRESRRSQPLLPLATVLPARADQRKWLLVAAGVALFAGLLGLLIGDGADRRTRDAESAARAAASRSAESSRPQAEPVLARARAAFEAGRYESPPGRNALDLYAAVLLVQPSQPEALTGLDRTVAWVVGQARTAAAAGNRAEAERLLERLKSAAPASAATARLAQLLEPRPQAHAPPRPAVRPAPAAALARTSDDLVVTTPVPAPAALPPVAARAAVKPAVYADPLAPRIANSDELRVKALLAERWRRGALRPGAPVASLPTAGYVGNDRAMPPSAGPAAPALDSGAVATVALPVDAVDRVFAIDPIYPAAALQNRIEGWVELMFTITETGAVRDIEVMDAQPRGVFESAATQAVGNWRYRPRLANGQPVVRRSVVTLRFNLDG